MWRSISNNALLFLIACFVLSCDRQAVIIPKVNKTLKVEVKDKSAGNEKSCTGEGIEDTLRRLVVATNLPLAEARGRASDLIMEILRVRDEKKAFQLCDELLEMAISQEVTVTDCNRRQDWYAMLWWDAMFSFIGAQRKQGNDYVYWDKIFRFYAKYTKEIIAVEKLLKNLNARLNDVHHSVKDVNNKERYLFLIKGELKTWVRVMRDFEFPRMNKNYTPEQKADILRRLKEVEKYTATPPHYPGGKRCWNIPSF